MAGRVIVVMGVSGAGKSTVGALLARRLGWDFAEGDELHPAANVRRMAAGLPLTDEDREPWLAAVAGWIDHELRSGRSGVIACSALRRGYRDRLRRPDVLFVYLEVGRAELERRLTHRSGHFMPASLLDSQLEALEPPAPEERAITVHATDDAGNAVAAVIARLQAD